MADTDDKDYVWATPRAFKLLQRDDLNRWFDAGVEKGASHLLVLDLGVSGGIEPLYVYPSEEGMKAGGVSAVALGDPDHSLYSRWCARTVLEVYHLGMDKTLQLETHSRQRPFQLYIPEITSRPTLHPDALKSAGQTEMAPREVHSLADLSDRELWLLEMNAGTISNALRHRRQSAAAGTEAETWAEDTSKALRELYEIYARVKGVT